MNKLWGQSGFLHGTTNGAFALKRARFKDLGLFRDVKINLASRLFFSNLYPQVKPI